MAVYPLKATLGLRERDRLLPVTAETVFEIGSLTKAFTATASLVAVERNSLDLDRPINLAGDLLVLNDSDASRQLSVADILSQRTGLPSNDLLWYLGSPAREDLLRALTQLRLLPDGFRRTFTYSNLLYGALGHIFDALVGEVWEAYVNRHILEPLGMTSTSFRPAADEGDVALPYVGTRRVARVDLRCVAAAGAMRASLNDMIKWVRFQLSAGVGPTGRRLISENAVARIRRKHVAVENANPVLFTGLQWLADSVDYGLGWFLGSFRNLPVLFHSSFIDGFSSAMVLIPDKQLGAVVLTNVNLSDTPGLLVRELFEEILTPDLHPSASADASWSRGEIGAVAGTYDNPAYGPVSVQLGPKGAVLRYQEREWVLRWTSDSDAEFGVEAFGIVIPLSVRFDIKTGSAPRLRIPFSLDQRVEPQEFTRRSE